MPILWYQKAYDLLFFWHQISDQYFCWKLHRQLQRLRHLAEQEAEE